MTTALHRALAMGATLTLALALTACGGSDSGDDVADNASDAASETLGADSTANPTDAAADVTASPDPANNVACQLLTTAELETITGLAFSTSQPEDTTSNSTSTDCEWWLDESVGVAGVAVQVMDGQSDQLAMTREVANASFGDVVDVDVEGTTGSFSYMGGMVIGMSIDGDYVQVMFVTFQDGDSAAITEALAEAVAANY